MLPKIGRQNGPGGSERDWSLDGGELLPLDQMKIRRRAKQRSTDVQMSPPLRPKIDKKFDIFVLKLNQT